MTTGGSPFTIRSLTGCQRFLVEIRRLPGGHVYDDGKRDGRLQPVPGQGRLQYMPPRRQREHSDARDRLEWQPLYYDGDRYQLPVAASAPLFTCFGFANLGLPLNPRDAIYYQTTPDPFGFTPNSFGFGFRDLGLGTFLRSGPGSAPNPNQDWTQFAPSVDGQMQVATARNVAMTPPQCPTTEAPRAVFPEGVLSQWVRQEPEATRPFLQYARRVSV